MNRGSNAIWTATGTSQSIVEKNMRPSARTRLEKPVETTAPARRINA